jgi:hypothetical protein
MKRRKVKPPPPRGAIARYMDGRTYVRRITRMGLSQAQAGPFFGVSDRTSRAWAQKGTPKAIAMLIKLMDREDYTVEDAEGLL